MSATLLRSRKSGEILFFFLVKDSEEELYPMVRRSRDEGKTWSEPLRLHHDPGYYVMNNARVIQLKSGRILCPMSFTSRVMTKNHEFRNVVYYSDDDGRTFRRSPSILSAPKRGAMEPGLIELIDGRVLQIIRTQVGQVWHSISSDGGVTWPAASPWTVAAPESPSTIFRLPPAKSGTPGELVIIYNPSVKAGSDHSGPRTPLAASLSTDEGRTWSPPKIIESDPAATYAYTSATLHREQVLLTYYYGKNKLYSQRFKSLPVSWFREP
jgi:sialidase-1